MHLVIIGATPEGCKNLIGFTDDTRESAHDWRELSLHLKRRWLRMSPELMISDGGLGFWKAAGGSEIVSQSRHVIFSRICWMSSHWRRITSSVSVTVSPSFLRCVPPQNAHVQLPPPILAS
jgi:hypothetical protein